MPAVPKMYLKAPPPQNCTPPPPNICTKTSPQIYQKKPKNAPEKFLILPEKSQNAPNTPPKMCPTHQRPKIYQNPDPGGLEC